MKFNFLGPSYESESLNIDAQQSINLYVELDKATGKPALLGTPGLTLFATLPTTPVRGLWAGEDRLFAVGGSVLYEVTSGGSVTSRGTVADDATHSPVQIFPNGTQLMIVSAGHVYYDNGAGPVEATFTDSDFTDLEIDASDNTKVSSVLLPFTAGDVGRYINITGGTGFTVQMVRVTAVDEDGVATVSAALGTTGSTGGEATQPLMAKTGCFLDSYGIVAYPESKVFYFSEPGDFTSWDAGEFSVKEGYPDNISSIIANHSELWLFGTNNSTEVWRNEGDAEMAGGFRRDPGAHMHYACVAPFSVANLDGPAWLGGDTRGRISAYRAQGFSAVRVSTHGVEQAWSTYSTVADAISWVQEDKGHTFWWITFPTANATWVYDLSTDWWHQRSYWNGSAHDRHRARCGCFVFGKHLVGDHSNGKIYEMSRTVYTDAGDTIRRVRSAPHVSDELKRIFYSRIEFELEVTEGQAPDVILDWSNDGGHSFQTPRTIQPSLASRQGRVIANRLGSAHRPRVFRITITDPVKIAIVDAYLEANAGNR
jgi:hypothetical protein